MDHSKAQLLKYESLISQMTLEEKASLMSGANFWNTKSIERLGVPSIMLTDGPHGLRKQGGKADHLGLNKSIPATCFPPAGTIANSWDLKLAYEMGECLGKEAVSEDVSVLLGPGLNIKRNPLCGRNFEYFSEDPFLSGNFASQMVQGIQSQGISACPKHFAVNSQETHRMTVDEVVDKRALHELYLEGFRYAIVDGKPKTIMTSYNKVNGTYANENEYLLKDVLREEWGYEGLVVTDWGGNNDRVAGVKAGNALEMPSTNGVTDAEIVEAVNNGTLNISILDKRVDEVLSLVYSTKDYLNKGKNFSDDDHHNKAIEIAIKSMVLLKNEGNVLPLTNKQEKICAIGDFANNARYQGAGSSLINPTKVDNFVEMFRTYDYNFVGYAQGFRRLGGKNARLKNNAVNLAKNTDKVLLFIGLDEGSEAEGVDRKHMRITQNQLDLFDAIYEVNKNIIIVLCGGSPIEMPFASKAKAILHTYLAGQGVGTAICEVLTGKYSPSGKLAETYPVKYEDSPSAKYYPGKEATSEHRESIYIGYRYFDKADKEVLYPFGYGLSYTDFEYSDLVVNGNSVKVTVKNIGSYDGEEIIQVYVKSKNSKVFKAEKELKGFTKIYLTKGESKTVEITLDEHAFAYFNVENDAWVVEECNYEILVGASSRDIRLSQEVNVNGETIGSPYVSENVKSYNDCRINDINDFEFKSVLGREIPEAKWDRNKKLGYNDMITQGKYSSGFGKGLYYLIYGVHLLLKKLGKPITANNVMFVLELPFRGVARMSAGAMSYDMLDGLLIMINGKFFKGLSYLIKASIRNNKKQKEIIRNKKKQKNNKLKWGKNLCQK